MPPPPPPTGGDYTEINSSTGSTKLYKDSVPDSTRVHKILPNGWVLKSISVGQSTTEVEDEIDGTHGWIDNDKLDSTVSQSDASASSSPNISDRGARIAMIESAVKHYYNDSNLGFSLYDSDRGNGIRISTLKNNSFPLSAVFGVLSFESGGINFDNNWVAGDFGHGISQVTSRSDVGLASNIAISKCELGDRKTNGCYSEKFSSGVLERRNYTSYEYYDNSPQSIFANVKDGLNVLSTKYGFTGNSMATGTISLSEMRFASTVYRYNQGSPFKTQLAYEVWAGKSNDDIRAGSLAPKLNLVLSASTTEQNAWMNNVRSVCKTQTFKECLLIAADNTRQYVISPLYLSMVAKQMVSSTFGSVYEDAVLADKFKDINESGIIVSLGSSANLYAVDAFGRKTGVVAGINTEDIPNSASDQDSESVSIFYPESSNKYLVVGTETGSYFLSAFLVAPSEVYRFLSASIPINKNDIHYYTFSKSTKISTGLMATIQVDLGGKGTIDKTIKADLILTADKFVKSEDGKNAICHRPPGNPGNSHTLYLPASAIFAHLAHGDKRGECESDKGDKEKEKNKEEGGDDEDKQEEMSKNKKKDSEKDMDNKRGEKEEKKKDESKGNSKKNNK